MITNPTPWRWDGKFSQGWYAAIQDANGDRVFTLQRHPGTEMEEAAAAVRSVLAAVNGLADLRRAAANAAGDLIQLAADLREEGGDKSAIASSAKWAADKLRDALSKLRGEPADPDVARDNADDQFVRLVLLESYEERRCVTLPMIVQRSGLTEERVKAALIRLRKCKQLSTTKGGGGVLWYGLSPTGRGAVALAVSREFRAPSR